MRKIGRILNISIFTCEVDFDLPLFSKILGVRPDPLQNIEIFYEYDPSEDQLGSRRFSIVQDSDSIENGSTYIGYVQNSMGNFYVYEI